MNGLHICRVSMRKVALAQPKNETGYFRKRANQICVEVHPCLYKYILTYDTDVRVTKRGRSSYT